MVDMEYLDGIGIKTFTMESGDATLPSRIKMTVDETEKPSSKMEMLWNVKTGTGVGDFDVLINWTKEPCKIKFALVK
jgi:hypothetical protein